MNRAWAGRLDAVAEPWNVNIHYDATLAGCGDGFLAARLARRVSRLLMGRCLLRWRAR